MTAAAQRPGTDPVAELRQVSHVHGAGVARTQVLTDITLRVAPGELVVLSGRSGSGKSTLLHLLAGVMRPTRGEVEVAGRRAVRVADWAVSALMPQRGGLARELTIGENVALPALLRGRPVPADLLDALGLAALADRTTGETSLGEQQRAALARALVLDPVIALLDEPTGHQDDEHVALILDAVAGAGARGTAVLVATHDERLRAIAHRVVPLEGGRIPAEPGRHPG